MHVNGTLVELMVKEVEASVKFYADVLDFSLVMEESEEGKKYWALMELEGFKISFKDSARMKKEVPFLNKKSIGGTAVICFQVDDLEGYYSRTKKRCQMLDHPHLTPCGARAFSLLDNSGYVLTIEKFD